MSSSQLKSHIPIIFKNKLPNQIIQLLLCGKVSRRFALQLAHSSKNVTCKTCLQIWPSYKTIH